MRRADGQRLRTLREARRLSQEQLAYQAGVSKSTVASIEQGNTQTPNWLTLRALASVLDTDVDGITCDEAATA